MGVIFLRFLGVTLTVFSTYYVTDKISSNDISLAEYVTTDCILQNKKGREVATNLPPQPCSLIRYQRGDVLIANIRPYLKKVWFADIDGGASPDVLVFRAKDGHSPSFLYAILLQDSFFDYVMQGTKGSKMPRGDKEQILRYEMPTFSCSEESIGTFFLNLDRKIHLNERINQNLEAIAKQLYDYWFVQFDFPDENGRPYKSSGGEMVWNEKLKREVPKSWKDITFNSFINKNKAGDWGYDMPKDGTIKVGCVRGADIVKLNDIPIRYITSKHSDRLLEDGDIVIEVSGGSPVQATGRVALITNGVIERNGGTLVCSNFCQSFSMKKRVFSEYFYYLWQNLYDNDNMFNFEGKTSGIKNFQTEVFLANYWFEVPEQLIETFHAVVSQYHLMIDLNIIENNNLIKQRDELLPLLMNGQALVNSDLSHD
ncbi:restriction endonuclease subunit S [Alistipes onderdonkii]|uniref:restriction endonuclease subunit S n=1 Tax=Alistipes onderdonkii TaxID=328813 RepID=UPI0020CAFA32|nr:restriction endonuclease subunit S [Alistipes onderdonkii]